MTDEIRLTSERKTELYDNYMRVLENIENARLRRGGGDVTLLAATKTVPVCDILYLTENFGLKLCGENHAQEFRDKFEAVTASGAGMDFIGYLQSNKIKYVAGRAGLIHSLDSIKLAEELDKKCASLGVKQGVLIEVNIGDEESKSGIRAEETEEFFERISDFSSLEVRGMMTMAPKCAEKEDFRKYFRESYRIFLDIFDKKTHNIREPVLSMGMSDSYECAIEEGSTLVRVGSAIFGHRVYN